MALPSPALRHALHLTSRPVSPLGHLILNRQGCFLTPPPPVSSPRPLCRPLPCVLTRPIVPYQPLGRGKRGRGADTPGKPPHPFKDPTCHPHRRSYGSPRRGRSRPSSSSRLRRPAPIRSTSDWLEPTVSPRLSQLVSARAPPSRYSIFLRLGSPCRPCSCNKLPMYHVQGTLDLTGCAVRQERVSSLKHSCPDEEWEEILVSLFAHKTPEGVQVTGKVEEGRGADDPPTHLTIEVRRSVQGITVSLYPLRCPDPCPPNIHRVRHRNTLEM